MYSSENMEDVKDEAQKEELIFPESADVGNFKDPKPECVEMKPETFVSGTMEADSDPEEDLDNSDIKEEPKKEDSDSSSCSNYSNEDASDSSRMEDNFQKVKVKSYTSITVKEEPFENYKSIFKETSLEFERKKYHQQIFEEMLQESDSVSVKHLQDEYLSHLHQAAHIEIFTCSLCQYETMNLANLNCHLLIIHNGKLERDIYRCNICNYEANYKSCMAKHLLKHRTPKKPVKVQSTVHKKQKRRANPERFPCMSCSYVGRSEEKLKKHLLVHKDRSNCDLCSFQSNDKEILQKHKESHKEGDKKFKCYMCTYTITNKATLGRHLMNVHKIANEASKRSKMCEICSFSCSSKNQLQIHYLTHKTVQDLKEDEIFKCPEPGCGHQTKLKCHLRVHLKTHKAPDFICEICGFATRRKESYRNHLVTHKRLSEIEWLRCNICPYQARNKKLLRRHMRNGDHSGKLLRHIRNRDRRREAEENGVVLDGQTNTDPSKVKEKKTRRRRKKKNLDLDQIVEQIEDQRLGLLASLGEMT